MNGEAVIQNLKAIKEAMDLDAFLALFTPDATVKIGNFPAANGVSEIDKLFDLFRTYISRMSFTDSTVEETPTGIIWLSIISFHRKDGTVLTVPDCVILRMKDGKIHNYHAFLDAHDLFPL